MKYIDTLPKNHKVIFCFACAVALIVHFAAIFWLYGWTWDPTGLNPPPLERNLAELESLALEKEKEIRNRQLTQVFQEKPPNPQTTTLYTQTTIEGLDSGIAYHDEEMSIAIDDEIIPTYDIPITIPESASQVTTIPAAINNHSNLLLSDRMLTLNEESIAQDLMQKTGRLQDLWG